MKIHLSKLGRKLLTVGGLSFAIFIFLLLIFQLDFVKSIEDKTIDFRSRLFANSRSCDSSIVFVAVDESSLDYFDNLGVGWPWPREFYAETVDYLNSCGAKSIIFDIDFSSNQSNLEITGSYSDSIFCQSINDAGNVFLISSLSKPLMENTDDILTEKKILNKGEAQHFYQSFQTIKNPGSRLINCGAKTGVINLFQDDDGVIRVLPLQFNMSGKTINHIALEVPLALLNDEKSKFNLLNSIPFNANKMFRINWYGAGGPGETFPYYSISSLIVSNIKENSNEKPILSPSNFKNKIVIIGGTAVGLLDNRITPMSSYGPYPGMEIHGTVISNILNRHFIVETPSKMNYLLSLIFVVFVIAVFMFFKRILTSIFTIISVALIYFVIALLMFKSFLIILPLLLIESSILFSLLFVSIFSYATEGKQKREIKKLFGRYVSPNVIEEVLANPGELKLGGRKIFGTIFFSDIKGFTSISELYKAEELVKFLNDYFTRTSNVILNHKAMLDKYIGDSIMAVFGAPVSMSNHAVSACIAALEIQEELHKDYLQNKQKPRFNTRIGLNSGEMIVGNIGSELRVDYTAIGDSVNLASRLEGMNKIYGTKIIVSDSTYKLVKDEFEFRELDRITVVGKNQSSAIYELVGRKDSVDEVTLNFISNYQDGLKNYRLRKWDIAIEYFNKCLDLKDSDLASKVMIDRINEFKLNNPGDNWDGVFHSTIK